MLSASHKVSFQQLQQEIVATQEELGETPQKLADQLRAEIETALLAEFAEEQGQLINRHNEEMNNLKNQLQVLY